MEEAMANQDKEAAEAILLLDTSKHRKMQEEKEKKEKWNECNFKIIKYLKMYLIPVPPGWNWNMPLPYHLISAYEMMNISIFYYCAKEGWIPPFCGWNTTWVVPKDCPQHIVFHVSYYMGCCYNGYTPPCVEWIYRTPAHALAPAPAPAHALAPAPVPAATPTIVGML